MHSRRLKSSGLFCFCLLFLIPGPINGLFSPAAYPAAPDSPDPGYYEAVAKAYTAAAASDAPLRNALNFYLRFAGILWVTLEWIAASVLWRTYRLLHAVAQSRGLCR